VSRVHLTGDDDAYAADNCNIYNNEDQTRFNETEAARKKSLTVNKESRVLVVIRCDTVHVQFFCVAPQNAYQIQPKFHNKFNPNMVMTSDEGSRKQIK
jgi:glycerol-3-phosphate cytidylyltransferase-like family protein